MRLMSRPYLRLSSAALRSVRYSASQFGAAAISLVFPPCCAHCQQTLDCPQIGPQLCDSCRVAVFTPQHAGCPRCGAYGVRRDAKSGGCLECRDTKLWFDTVVSLGTYEGPLRQSVVQMKYEGGQSLAVAAGKQLAVWVGRSEIAGEIDLVSCVPKYWLKRITAGGNNVESIMSGLANELKKPFLDDLLACSRRIKKQSMLSPDQRRRNVRGAWSVASGYEIAGAHILLVDDVMTTGATANEASKALKKAGATRVSVAVIGRAERVY